MLHILCGMAALGQVDRVVLQQEHGLVAKQDFLCAAQHARFPSLRVDLDHPDANDAICVAKVVNRVHSHALRSECGEARRLASERREAGLDLLLCSIVDRDANIHLRLFIG